MRRRLLAIGALWLAIIGGMAGMKEYTLRTGREVVLKTVPVDPRDLFRGDYVILSYELSRLDLGRLGVGRLALSPGQAVYVPLRLDGRYALASGIRTTPPEDGALYLKGRVQSVAGQAVQVEYGIESYFVPEGQGRALEQVRGKTLDVVAAVDQAGSAAIKRLLLDGQDVRFK